ncbi:MAG: hypothetical protein A3K19_10960 [Lentisphaerae bacterium RIFOXYB12_FULL_65_16]|nr:MAG: hypothetical protein A3K18_18165 [Lentisphaerae bacterium RIFOXYA12_64_32]OGV87862.1 MAG: hypothetical protein A3K19_10960 [Lentisphaerae bacterium RIFOXYB12_FULL_65_16]
MATKTISIDLEAYERLRRARMGDESFSRVIKRVVRPAIDLSSYFAKLDRHPLGDAARDAVAAHELGRHRPAQRDR